MEKTFWRAIIESDNAIPPGHSVEELTPELLSYLGSTDLELRYEIAHPM